MGVSLLFVSFLPSVAFSLGRFLPLLLPFLAFQRLSKSISCRVQNFLLFFSERFAFLWLPWLLCFLTYPHPVDLPPEVPEVPGKVGARFCEFEIENFGKTVWSLVDQSEGRTRKLVLEKLKIFRQPSQAKISASTLPAISCLGVRSFWG